MTSAAEHRARPTPRRLGGDEGSVLAELALILPFLFVVILSILEFGNGFRERSNLSSALRSAARIDSTTGNGRSADYLALQSFYALMAQSKSMTVNWVTIYKTTASNGAPISSTCYTSGSSASSCSVYTWSQIQQVGLDSSGTVLATNFGTSGTTCDPAAWDANWCPLGRKANQTDPPDWVGIYANVTYKSVTGLMPKTVTMSDQVVYRIDPTVSLSG
jgi:Flp pilus assembly protein TadG